MGCKCKEKADMFKALSDDPIDDNDGKLGFFGKVFGFIMQIFFGIICGAIIIIVMVPFLIYLVFCLLFGLTPKLNLDWFMRKKKRLEDKA